MDNATTIATRATIATIGQAITTTGPTAGSPAGPTAGSHSALRSSTKLPPTQNKIDIIKRFLEVRPFVQAKANGRKKAIFHPHTFEKKAHAHVLNYKINEFGSDHRRIQNGGTVVIQQVATFENISFFRNPNNVTEGFSVCNAEMKKVMLERGYVPHFINHITEMSTLPAMVGKSGAGDTMPNLQEMLAPINTTLPNGKLSGGKLPPLWKKDKIESTADAIVRAIEERVVDEASQRVWSPYRVWDAEKRKKSGLKDSRLTKYFQAYYSKKVLKMDGPTLEAMAKRAVEHRKGTSSHAADWFEMVNNIYSREHTGTWTS
jgi:hypothetical protein